LSSETHRISVDKIKNICVIGAGTMGHGIAQVFAMAGYDVWMRDIDEKILENALNKISQSLRKLHSKGRLKEDPDLVISRIHTTLDVKEACENADFVIEAVPEILDLKKKIFSEIDSIAPAHAILASNTSSLPITELAEATKRPDKVIGMHFFNPPVILKLIEVIRSKYSSDEVVNFAMELARKIGKDPVLVKKDSPGFIVNRILGAIIHEALWLLEDGYSVEEVDSACKFKLGMPMGIFELIDFIGIDVVYHMMKAMIDRGAPFELTELIINLFNSNELGIKSGKGFYKYPAPGKRVKPSLTPLAGKNVNSIEILAPAINEAAFLVKEDIADMSDIDKAIKLGLNFPYGIFEIADSFGLDNVLNILNGLYNKRKFKIYEAQSNLKSLVDNNRLGRKTGHGFYNYDVTVEELDSIKIIYEKPLAWIILNRPDKLNALSVRMLNEISEAVDKIEKNKDVRAIILMGAGKAFCAGADIKGFDRMTATDAFKYSLMIQRTFEKIENCGKPVIAAVHGYALGGGLELAMASDLIIASKSTLIGQPEIGLGIIPGAGATQKLARLIGVFKAKELVFLGEMISTEEAERIGLVNQVILDNEIEFIARKLGLKLSKKPPMSLMIAKYVINYGKDIAEKIGKIIEALGFGLVRSTDEAAEGIRSFLERKKPKFS